MQDNARVLIIDDDPVIRILTTKALQENGLQTYAAASGEEGLECFKSHGADAILLDVVMANGMDGFDICAKLRELPDTQYMPILMMTGLEDLASINRAYEAGATDFITKPINIPLLSHRVRYMLRASQTTRNLKESEQRLHRLAYFDTLTNLPNRQFFLEHMRIMVAIAQRQNTKLSVLFLDLDGFKRINETLGHHKGDSILKVAGDRLRKCLRSSDTIIRMETDSPEESSIARLGGDEFTVLLNVVRSNEDSALVAERIRVSLAEPFVVDGQEFYTTTSIGISNFPADGEIVEDLLKNADLAMYHAKRIGGNNYQYFSSEMTESAKRRLTVENHLRKAIEQNEFDLHFQPQVDITTGKVSGLEALIRWNCLPLGFVSPAEFIPLAEEMGFIVDIGEWVLRKACHLAKNWQTKGLSFNRLAINISAVQLLHKGFTSVVQKIITETEVDAHLLEFEVTESALIDNETEVLEVLHALKKFGISLAMDDFGTGYSSLSRLMEFPLDRIKIDQAFVSKIGKDKANAAIVIAVIAMAQGMDMKVIAEGVETEDQLNFLKVHDCDEVQGYLLSKPLPTSQIPEFLVA